jgi:translation initiation factor 3 subunit H
MSNFLNALTDDKKLTEPVTEVVIDGLAVLKIVKHCNDNLPTMVAGSLLGLDVNGILEVTYVYPFLSPQSKADIDTTIEGML